MVEKTGLWETDCLQLPKAKGRSPYSTEAYGMFWDFASLKRDVALSSSALNDHGGPQGSCLGSQQVSLCHFLKINTSGIIYSSQNSDAV